jgi:hypothetical protein
MSLVTGFRGQRSRSDRSEIVLRIPHPPPHPGDQSVGAGATFLGLLDTREIQRLEWIIILLIGVEILLFIGKDLITPLWFKLR